MGRVRRGGYVIDWWIGDHTPRHVHVYRNGMQVAKVEMPGMMVLAGTLRRPLRRILEQLVKEGRL